VTRLLYAGLLLVAAGFAYRSLSFMSAMSVVGGQLSVEQKSSALASSVSSAECANYVIGLGVVLVAGCGARLIARSLDRTHRERSTDEPR
jgi:hypothetical protein